MRQGISVGVANHFLCRRRIPCEVALAGRVAPGSFRIPMPGLNKQLGVLPIADRTPPCLKNLLYLVRPEKDVGCVGGNTIHRGTQGTKRAERVCDMTRSCIDADRL